MIKVPIGTSTYLGLDAGVDAQAYTALVLVEVAESGGVLIAEVLSCQVALVDDLLVSHLGLLLLQFVPQVIIGLIVLDLLLRVQ